MIHTMRTKVGQIAAVALLATLVTGCQSFLDVNTDPNAPVNAPVSTRLAPLVTGFGHAVYYGSTQFWGSEWMEYFAYCCTTRHYAEIEYYELQDNDPNGPWDFAYTSILNEAKLIMAQSDKDKQASYYGIAEFLSAWTWAHLTDMWGPIPYTEALDPSIPAPKYDDQQTVYAGVYASLNDAIAEMQKGQSNGPAGNDLLFGGDMSRWVKLAYMEKAKLEMRLAYAPGEDPKAHADSALAALSHGFTSNADDADFTYPGGSSARNPLWTFIDDEGWLYASNYFVNLETTRNDPRIGIFLRPALTDSINSGTIVYRGHVMGADGTQNDSTMSFIGPYFDAENAPLNWESYADGKFIEAEAQLILNGAAAADAPYRAGITANMQKMGVAQADIDTYLAARPSLATVANPLQELMTEKYLANFMKIDAWNDYRRTGYPHPPVPTQALLPDIPQRIRTPSVEVNNNGNSVAATGIDTGLNGMETKVWWASGQVPAAVVGRN